ncbi:MAG: 4-fold beta flower protein [Thermodesulfobacteriota bacterium]
MDLYTKNGRPLQVLGDIVYSRSGTAVGRLKGEKVFGTDGRYVGTIVGDRLVHRSTDSAGISSPFSAANRIGSARANRVGSAIWGDEPDFPD